MSNPLTEPMETSVAKSIAPEDLRRGDFVAILTEIHEYPSFFWFGDWHVEPDEPVRVRLRAADAGVPLKVKAVCLPFLFVKLPTGEHRTVDVRHCHLVRLDDAYARTVWNHARRKHATESH